MERQHGITLELPKVLVKLASYTAFSGGTELAQALEPSTFPEVVAQRLAETREARALLSTHNDIGLGGVRDIRPLAGNAARGLMLLPPDLLSVRSTLRAARELRRALLKLQATSPRLAAIAQGLFESTGIINEIGRCIDEDNLEVRDDATPELATIRRELRESLSRVQEKLRRIIAQSHTAKYLQEAIITQRGGRFVIPIKADFKGRIPGIVHDQSASGATLFVEPLSTVDLNNKMRELQLREEREVQHVLQMLSNLIGQEAPSIVNTVALLAELDLIFAKANYADAIDALEPRLETGPRSTLRLIRARHPLLDPATVVPLDLDLDPSLRIVVITGPNTGGKTVALKTIGLMALMTQCGLHIPAGAGSTVCLFDQVFADIGDEQSIEQSLSTFSSHLVNIIGFIDRVTPRSLALFDELGAGTDPAEGSALARSILDHMRSTGALTIVATHYPELKLWAHATEGAINASVEFDPETLRPTYKLTVGLPGRSNAFAIATRLGLQDEIVSHARSMVAESDLKAEDLLAELHQQRDAVERSREAAERARLEVEASARQLRERLDHIEAERAAILETAQAEAQQQLDALRDEIDRVRAQLSAAQRQGEVEAIEAQAAELAEQVEASVPPAPIEKPSLGPRHPVRVGDAVFVNKLDTAGEVISIDGGIIEVLVGTMRMKTRLDEIEWRSSPSVSDSPTHSESADSLRLATTARLELDLRGLRADEAVAEVERQIDAAYLSGFPFVRIIHGKGSGALRKAVREALQTNPAVKAVQAGKEEEGGDGVTIAVLASDS